MKSSRVYLLLKLFVVTMIIFMSQKTLFMIYNSGIDNTIGISDYLSVVLHSVKLDMTVTGYTLVVPLLVLCATYFVRINLQRVLFPYYILITFLTTLIFVADTVMYGFWHFKLDTTVFIYTDKPADALASVNLWFIILCILTFLILLFAYLYIIYKVLPKSVLSPVHNKFVSLVMMPLTALLFIIIRGGVGNGTANVSNAYYSDKQFLNHSSVNPVFNMLYSMAHQQDFSKEFHYYSDDSERASLVKGIYNTGGLTTDTILNTRRPNILLIVWEGCSANIAGCLGSDSGATPNLDKLASEGILFSNCQANSFRTDRGLVSINSGWLGLPTASLMKIPEKSQSLPGIAKTLRNHGYNTDFWYGGDISFTNMGGFMLQNGFQKTYSDKDFNRKERQSNWGAPDEHVFNRVLIDIKSRNNDVPWFTEIMTLSSHEPWDVPYKRLEKKIENSFAYTDHCIGTFISELKKLPLWKNTLIIIVPDHGVLSSSEYSFSSPEVIHIPLVFAGGAVSESRNIDILMNQSDIAATLLGQLGISHSDFLFSRNVLSSTYTRRSAFHTTKVDMTYFDESGFTTIDLTTNKPVRESPSSSISRAQTGRAILQTLYDDTARRGF